MTTQSPSFIFVGNDLALDFINTLILHENQTYDLWQKPEDLSIWVTKAGFCLSEPIDDAALSKAKILRTALRQLFTLVISQQEPKPDHLTLLNATLSIKKPPPIVQMGEAGLELKEDNQQPKFAEFLAEVAMAAALQLTAEDLNRLRSCSNQHCVISFKDTSKSGRRKWCNMETCGNRTKVAKHYHSTR